MSMHVRGAVIFVRDLTTMTAFYRDVLGLLPLGEDATETWIEFAAGRCRVGLHSIPAHLSDVGAIPTWQPREHCPIRLDFAVPNLEAERQRLEAAGVRLLVRPWGALDIVDPEGNVLGLREDAAG
jgi:catechol 2,3-dioxygenase-like lactoylglutathione lyase family enzyme